MAKKISAPRINKNVILSDSSSSSSSSSEDEFSIFNNILNKEIEERIEKNNLFRYDSTNSIRSAENLAKAIFRKSHSPEISIRYYSIKPQVNFKKITYVIYVSQHNIPDFLTFDDQLPEVLVVKGKTSKLIIQHCDNYILNAKESNHHNT